MRAHGGVCQRAPLGLLALALGACRGGCGPTTPPTPPRDQTLALLPASTRFVASVDLAKIRASTLWTRVAALAQDSPQDRQRIADLTARTGLDPLRQIHRLVAGFPDNARESGQFALIVDGEGFDERKLVDYARKEAGVNASSINARTSGQRTLWVGPGRERFTGFFDGSTRFVLGGGGWGEIVADLVDHRSGTPSALGNGELESLCARIDRRRALWFAALVPADVRRLLLADPKLDNAASVTRLALAADLGPGLNAELVADLSNAVDARALVARLETTIRESKRNAQVLMAGLGPYLDAVSAKADGPTVRLAVSLGEPQIQDLLERLTGLVRLARERK